MEKIQFSIFLFRDEDTSEDCCSAECITNTLLYNRKEKIQRSEYFEYTTVFEHSSAENIVSISAIAEDTS